MKRRFGNSKTMGKSETPPENKCPVLTDERMSESVESIIPKKRQDFLKWYGWGYNDTRFYSNGKQICFKGEKYPLDKCALPYFTDWVFEKFGVTLSEESVPPEMPTEFPAPVLNDPFVNKIKAAGISCSESGPDRLIRCHGQTLFDIYKLLHNEYKRIPDMVVWPKCHDEVVKIVNLADEHNVVVIPYGGGTSVSGSITCPENEKRMMCVLDTSQMNRLLWLSKENLTVCFEAGIFGLDLEQVLNKLGFTLGHQPDSYEFSTLGGWVATRASGMKKNVYGNIEDLVVRVKMVTSKGVLERQCSAPRISCGPDFNHIILGSEGTLGVVTEVVLKIRPIPPVKQFGSLVFPDFERGVLFMREVARRRCQPASVRLVDNDQFVFGQTLKPMKSTTGKLMDIIARNYITKIKGFDLNKICAVTLLFEGEAGEVQRQEKLLYEIAKKYKGFSGGSQNGERGYILTFVIAYIRDFAIEMNVFGESFETSVPWDRCSSLCRNVKLRLHKECVRLNIKHFLISCRVTQTYDAGCCVYFYFCFTRTGIEDPIGTYEAIENSAREEILASGGSISHHHGVGKLRSRWYKGTVSEIGLNLYEAAKKELDPKNIFALGNLKWSPDHEHNATSKIDHTPKVRSKL